MCSSSNVTKYSCNISSWISVLDSSEWTRQSIFFLCTGENAEFFMFFLLLTAPFPPSECYKHKIVLHTFLVFCVKF
jgi:hypothetical protein